MPRKTSPADLENAIQLYLSGESRGRAAKRFAISERVLACTLAERGLARSASEARALGEQARRAKFMARYPLPMDAIIASYQAGESVNALAAAYAVSRTTIRERLVVAGIPMRDSTAANRLMMSKRTADEHLRNTEAAHAAVRGNPEFAARLSAIHKGRSPSLDAQCKAALTRERRQVLISPAETLIAVWLEYEHGIDCVQQKAVGPYNLDLAIDSVAVEIYGGGWHAAGDHYRRSTKRLRYILDQGFNLMVIWTNLQRHPLRIEAAHQVARFVEESRRNPALRGEHRVIWGDGEALAGDCPNVEHLADVPARGRRHGARASN